VSSGRTQDPCKGMVVVVVVMVVVMVMMVGKRRKALR
jgi:hypothetical protein